MLVFSLLEAQSSNLAKVAGFITCKADRASRYRRLQRFMEQVHLVPGKLAPLLLYIMEVPQKAKLALVLDRTNWKFGKADCNILYLAVVWQGTNSYFCDPYASWQKGGIENSNGRLRRDLPRRTDVRNMSKEEFDEVISNYNMTPRKSLGWLTPLEAFHPKFGS